MSIKNKYKFIHFEPITKNDWVCYNTKHLEVLGNVDYMEDWKQFVYQPADMTEYSFSCLLDIADFIKQLNELKRGKAS